MRRARSRTRQKITALLIERDGTDCHVCRLPFTESEPATIDHLLEHSKGGTYTLTNLKLAHQQCNAWRSNNPHRIRPALNTRARQYFGVVTMEFPGRTPQKIRIVGMEVESGTAWLFGRYFGSADEIKNL